MRIIVALLIAIAASGCAMGNKHGYTATRPQLAPQGTLPVAVVVQDVRPYILTKEKTPDFVGIQRGGFGNPFDVTTESGRPLADDFSSSIADALSRKGFKATQARAPAGKTELDARSVAADTKASRVALVTIHEWKSDTYMNTALIHEVTLRILDPSGATLANSRISGRDNLGGSAWNAPDHAKGAVPAAYSRKMEELFGTEAVIKSLR
jgi:hypothetical protein